MRTVLIIKFLIACAVFINFSVHVFAIDSAFVEARLTEIRKKNYAATELFLEQNRKVAIEDPEYYVLLLNYVIHKGDQSGVVIDTGKPQKGDYTLSDQKSGEAKGRFGFQSKYDEKLITDGISRVQEGLIHFKSRLDIHFGIVAVAERIERWDVVGDQLLKILKISKDIENKWTWGSVGSMSSNPKEFMIQNILARTSDLFRKDSPSTDREFLRISEALIQFYPEMVYGHFNIGVYHLAKKEYTLAKKYLEKANEIDPSDDVVLENLHKLKAAVGE